MVNWGILPLIFRSDEDYDSIKQGDILEIDTYSFIEGGNIKVINKNNDKIMYLTTPLFQVDGNAIKNGGFVNILKNKNSF